MPVSQAKTVLARPRDSLLAADTTADDHDPSLLPIPSRRNPYRPGRPIDNRECFFGRSAEVRIALSLLANLQSISMIGPRRIGKTSLLHYMSNPAVLEDHAVDPKQFVFGFMSCAQLSDLSREEILGLMLDLVGAGMNKAGFSLVTDSPPAAGTTFIDFSNALTRLTQIGPKLVFLLDEFEYLAQNRNLDPAFFAGLRSIASNLNVAYVTASGVSLLDLTYANSSVLGSPFFNIFSTIRLGLFDDRAARDLISNPSRAMGLPFSDATVEHILSLADHHPFFLQIACFHAFEMQSRNGTLTEADHALLRERVADELRDHFRSAWGRLMPEEKRLLSSLDAAQDIPTNQEVLETLKNQCLIRREGERWALLCSPWTDFVEAQARQVSPAASEREEAAAAELSPPRGSPEACTVSVQLTAGKEIQIAVEVAGAVRYVSKEPSTWEMAAQKIQQHNQAVNRIFSKDTEQWRTEAKRIGEDLYRDVIDSRREVHDALILGLGQRSPQEMHVRFLVSRDHLQLPLELLHDGKDWLALKHPLSKYITGERVRRPLLSGKLRQGDALRALLVAADVTGEVSIGDKRYSLDSIPGVDDEVEEIYSILQRATARLGIRFQPRILRSEEATYAEMRRELKEGDYDLLHYSGHASHDGEEPDHSALFLRESAGSGSPMAMTAGELKSLLENSTLRFAYFSCCAGATQASEDELAHNDFLGIVDAAVQAGLPSVLGMRWPVSDRSARALARAFYTALLPDGELDSALLAARQAMDRNDIAWISPVLVVQA